MRKNAYAIISALVAVSVSGCGTPSFELFGKGESIAPSGPKIEALLDNLKCEIQVAKTSTAPISYKRKKGGKEEEASFTLNIALSQIHYVATALYTLQVTNTEWLAPNLNKIYPYSTPMTNLTLSVGGQYNKTQDRDIIINTTIDLDVQKEEKPTDKKTGNVRPRIRVGWRFKAHRNHCHGIFGGNQE